MGVLKQYCQYLAGGENSRHSSLPARVAFCEKDETPLGPEVKLKDDCLSQDSQYLVVVLRWMVTVFRCFEYVNFERKEQKVNSTS